MAHLSLKENYFRMLNREIPEYVPTVNFGMPIGLPELAPVFGGFEGEKKDIFGVTYVTEATINYGALPKPGDFILKDITKWRDVIKRPEFLDTIDWELCASRDLANLNPEQIHTTWVSVGNGFFQLLMSFMGFDEGLCACVEEPEEVKDLLNFLLELNLEVGKKYIHYYKPDVFMGADDIAHERAPFVSEAVFMDLFEPCWRKQVELFLDAGIFTEHHNCGMFGPFVPHLIDMGYHSWNPAEHMNDFPALKKLTVGKLAICGGFDSKPISTPETTEEETRAHVKATLDLMAPGGSYAFMGFLGAQPGDEDPMMRSRWVNDEFEKLRYSYYN